MKYTYADKKVTFAATFTHIYRNHYGKIAVILRRKCKMAYNINFKNYIVMTDEEKKAQEEAAARAAAEAAAGGEGGNAGGEGGEGGENGDGGKVTPRDENGAPATEPMPRDVFFERIRTGKPDGKYDEDEQEYYRSALAMLDSAEEGDKKYKGMTEKMMRRYQEDPEEVAILLDYMEGMPLLAAIRKHKGDEALTIKEGDEGWEEYQRVGEERKADRQRYEQMMTELETNMPATVEEFNTWAEKNQLDDEQKGKIWETMQSDLDNMSRGKFTKEIFDRYFKALNYQNDVEGAHEQGKAEGKNAAIEAEQKRMGGSGLPGTPAGSVQEKEEPEQPATNGTAAFLKGIRRR